MTKGVVVAQLVSMAEEYSTDGYDYILSRVKPLSYQQIVEYANVFNGMFALSMILSLGVSERRCLPTSMERRMISNKHKQRQGIQQRR